MTCKEMFWQMFGGSVLSCISYIGEGFCILSVIMLMMWFLGSEGKITGKTFMPVWIMAGGVTGINLICLIYNYFVLMKTWNEPYVESSVKFLERSRFAWLIMGLVIFAIIFSAYFTFTKHKILNCFVSGIMIIVFETYISTEMVCSAMYFTNKPREYMLQITFSDQNLGSNFSYVFIFSYLLIMLSIFLLLYFGMIKPQRTMYVGWNNRILFILWELLMICIMCVPVLEGVSGKEQVKYMGYELGIVMPVMGIAVPFLMVTIISRRYALEKTLIQEDYISAELDYINQYKKNQNETRAFRHDIINNLSVLSAIHNEKNYDKAKEYLNTLLGDVRAMSPKYNTGDEMLDCIVGMKSAKMEEQGIDFTLEGVIDGGLGMKPMDICSIFANAFDNAIEACEKISAGSDKWISLSIKRTDKFFSIILRNSMPEEEKNIFTGILFGEGERVTSKKDRSLHGYGTHNMKATISRYWGMESVEIENGVFNLTIMIPRNN